MLRNRQKLSKADQDKVQDGTSRDKTGPGSGPIPANGLPEASGAHFDQFDHGEENDQISQKLRHDCQTGALGQIADGNLRIKDKMSEDDNQRAQSGNGPYGQTHQHEDVPARERRVFYSRRLFRLNREIDLRTRRVNAGKLFERVLR